MGQHADKVKAGRLGGLKGGPARAKVLTPAERSAIAREGWLAQQAALGHHLTNRPNIRARRRMKKGGSHKDG